MGCDKIKYRESLRRIAGTKDYLTISETEKILDDIERRLSLAVESMDAGLRYLGEAYDEIVEIKNDLY